MADEMPLRWLIDNIENADGYVPDNGKVDVTPSNDAVSVICALRDSGTRIPQEGGDHVSPRVYRAGTSLKAQRGGKGQVVKIALPRAHAEAGA